MVKLSLDFYTIKGTMPKKNVQTKETGKKVVEKGKEVQPKKTVTEKDEEEYLNVVDYETNKKYSKRLLTSNWSKYEELPDSDFDPDEKETPKTDDFNFLLQNASTDCAQFQFSSEKQWDTEDKSILSNELFNLDLNVLCSGLACIPFHTRIGLDESELSEEDKISFEKDADENREKYELVLKKRNGESLECKREESNLEKKLREELSQISLQTPAASVVGNVEQSKDNESDRTNFEFDITKEDLKKEVLENLKEIDNVNNETIKSTQKIFFSNEDKSLEEWLDSVLDD